ncbi:SDR family oxidoreductase [Paenibacillus taiwanensis]|uniref:SDR family oxidoreductase n=1 Tax=Paenibacillus taiwanensis TaxID=401638 RepID=UPI0003F6F9C4|nr:SDR family oxidoreductase [Paenibacillus taiwanensis]
MDLAGKKVVITGAGRGLGRAMAIRFAEMGAELFLAARQAGSLDETCQQIQDTTGHLPKTYIVDLCSPQQIQAFCTAVAEETAVIDIVVNNGATWLEGDLDSVTDEAISDTINSAALGTSLVTRHMLPLLRRSTAADIVNIISVCGLPNYQHETAHEAFYAAKFAQAGFTDRLRQRLKPEGIRVIAVYPPNFDDVSPLDEDWLSPRDFHADQQISNRHVIESITFALTRDRICAINAIQLDSWPSSTR